MSSEYDADLAQSMPSFLPKITNRSAVLNSNLEGLEMNLSQPLYDDVIRNAV